MSQLKDYTLVGTFEGGETFVDWCQGETVQGAIESYLLTCDGEEAATPESIVAVFEGCLTCHLSQVHDGVYPLDMAEFISAINQEGD